MKGAAVGAHGSAEPNRSQDVAQQLPSHVGNIFKRFTSLKQRLSLSNHSFIIGDILKSLKTSFVSESEPNMRGEDHWTSAQGQKKKKSCCREMECYDINSESL